ncbi:hypothetical protein H4R34_004575 [Dimargaris verticillata]|uniref:Uncharacterized protein n=1 Tax=Dimargaris verticillata TaxID=2761393 RepID=A0A9W8B595_9FUNG|nr:hypothetical protein H4R34_004575 [Dimargaris verticillata]
MGVLSKQVLTGLLQFYLANLEARPLVTKAVTAGTLQGLQEHLAQQLTKQPKPAPEGAAATTKRAKRSLIDPKVVQMALYGLLVSGPLGHVLYGALQRLLAKRRGVQATILLLLVSNLIISPIQNAVYIAAMALIAGQRQPRQLVHTVKTQLGRIQRVSWVLSPAAQLFVARMLRPALWPPFFNLLGFLFGTYFNVQAKRQRQQQLDP